MEIEVLVTRELYTVGDKSDTLKMHGRVRLYMCTHLLLFFLVFTQNELMDKHELDPLLTTTPKILFPISPLI